MDLAKLLSSGEEMPLVGALPPLLKGSAALLRSVPVVHSVVEALAAPRLQQQPVLEQAEASAAVQPHKVLVVMHHLETPKQWVGSDR